MGKDSRENKSKEGWRRMEGKLYNIESLSKERLDILQEMIDNWMEEDLKKRKEERKKRSSEAKSPKNNTA